MKYYSFLPGLLVAVLFAILLTLVKAFNLNIPLIKDISNPLLALVIAGFLMCAFGTISYAIPAMIKSARIDWQVVIMAAIGILILTIGGFALFSDKPVFGFLSKDASYYAIASLIVVKLAVSTLRIIRIA